MRDCTLKLRVLPAVLALALAACESGPPQVTTTFDRNKQLILAAGYTPTAQSNGIGAWADVPVGTPAVLEVTGPLHFRCQGQFRAPDRSTMDRPDLPFLDVGDGGAAVLTTPSFQATIQEGFDAGVSYVDAITGVYDLNIGCVPVADTSEQMQALLQRHVTAVKTWTLRVPDPTTRGQLVMLADQAARAVQDEDSAAAVTALIQIRDVVQPLSVRNPYYEILRDSLASIALLTQPTPPG